MPIELLGYKALALVVFFMPSAGSKLFGLQAPATKFQEQKT